MNDEQRRRAQAHAYMRGWEAGAAGQVGDGEMLIPRLVEDYAEGRRHGQRDRANARGAIAEVYDTQQKGLG